MKYIHSTNFIGHGTTYEFYIKAETPSDSENMIRTIFRNIDTLTNLYTGRCGIRQLWDKHLSINVTRFEINVARSIERYLIDDVVWFIREANEMLSANTGIRPSAKYNRILEYELNTADLPSLPESDDVLAFLTESKEVNV